MDGSVAAAAAAGGAVGSVAVALFAAVSQRRASRDALRDQALVRAHASFLAAMTKLAGADPRGRTVGEEELQLLVVDPSAGDYADKARLVLNSGLAGPLRAGADGPPETVRAVQPEDEAMSPTAAPDLTADAVEAARGAVREFERAGLTPPRRLLVAARGPSPDPTAAEQSRRR